MKLYVDDVRTPPESARWIIARNSKDAIDCLSAGIVEDLSIDHDLGGEDTGYAVMLYLEQNPHLAPAVMRCHSANPVGRKRIEVVMERLRSQQGDVIDTICGRPKG